MFCSLLWVVLVPTIRSEDTTCPGFSCKVTNAERQRHSDHLLMQSKFVHTKLPLKLEGNSDRNNTSTVSLLPHEGEHLTQVNQHENRDAETYSNESMQTDGNGRPVQLIEQEKNKHKA